MDDILLPSLKHTAIIQEDQHINYAVLYEIVQKKRRQLAYLGLKPKDRIRIPAKTDIQTIALLFACMYSNIDIFLVNMRLPSFFIEKELTGFRPLDFSSLTKEAPFPDTSIRDSQTYIFTSGTSAKPKIAIHSFENHYYSALGANENMPLGPGDKWLLSLPLYHVGGLAILFRCFLAGATAVIHTKTPEYITHLSYVPTQLYRLENPPPNLKCILVGGAKLSRDLYNQKKHLPLYLTYGMTEMSSQIVTTQSPIWKEGAPFLGFPLKYREIKIHNGELFVKGKTLFQGYLDSPFQKDWFSTGDLAEIDPELGLRILGRKDRQFISGGENIQPAEIERALLSLPHVLGARVIPYPDPEFGMRPLAFIKHDNTFIEEEIKALLKNKLASFKVPDRIYPHSQLSSFSFKNTII